MEIILILIIVILVYLLLKKNNNKTVNIGSAGGMTRLSTGYTFLNIQEHSKYIVKNIDKIEKLKVYNIGKKYQFLDKIFLKVLDDGRNLISVPV